MIMKNIKFLLFATLVISITSCIKQIEKQFNGNVVAEVDVAVLNTNASGVTYPIIARHPRPGIPLNTANSTTACQIPQADSTLRRIGREIQLRINLVGPQSTADRTVGYRVIQLPSSITTFAFPTTVAAVTTAASCSNPNVVFAAQTPTAAAGTLTLSDAIAGTHYTPLSGIVTIPANSSFGTLRIPLIAGTAAAGTARYIGIQLDSTGSVLPSLNYRTVGLVIDQR
jgi:hypothetical protein